MTSFCYAQTVIIPPQFEEALGFSEGLAAIKIDQRWGYVNIRGDVVIKPIYVEARNFHEGLAAVKTEKGWGYINSSNQFVIPAKFYDARDFNEGLAGIKIRDLEDGQCWKYIDCKGVSPFSHVFYAVSPFLEGVACVKLDDGWSYINKNGEFIKNIVYHTQYPYIISSGLFPAQGGDLEDYGYKGMDGKWVIEPQYRSVSTFENEVALVEEYGALYHFINVSGEKLSTHHSMPLLLGDNMYYVDDKIYKIGNWQKALFHIDKSLSFMSSFSLLCNDYSNYSSSKEWNMSFNHFLPEKKEDVIQPYIGPNYSTISEISNYIPHSLGYPSMGLWATKFYDKSGASPQKLWGFTTLNMQDFIIQNVESQMKSWLKKGEFESSSAYQKRTNETNRQQQMAMYANDLINSWLKKGYDKWTLSNYDADHHTYAMTTDIGQYIIKVEPQKAKALKENWENVEKEVQFTYKDGLTLERISFRIHNTNPFVCMIDTSLEYDGSDVSVDISGNSLAINIVERTNNDDNKQNKKILKPKRPSEVDIEIPTTSDNNKNTFAFIIGNEQYQRVSQVPFAQNDAKILGEYCHKTLGMPTQNVKVYENATYGTMIEIVSDMQKIAKAYKGNASLLFYYAGHGIPDETSNDGYLLPIDADGMRTEVCYSLNRLYRELGELQAKNVVVFVDACFSGAIRGNGMIVDARGVAIKVNNDRPTGKTIVFTAASDKQTAYPYEEKGHGLFTYFLLKKLHDTKGVCTLGELGDYVCDEVSKYAVVSNGKEQTPKVFYSISMADCWKNIRLK